MGVSRWHRVAILSGSRDITSSGFAAAIFEVRFPVTSGSIRNSASELVDHENGELAVGTALISILGAEISVLPVLRPPSLNTDFRLHRAVTANVPMTSWIPKILI